MFLESWIYDRPPVSLLHGPRGGGKSYLRAFAAHMEAIRYPNHDALILGGSLAQSRQVYKAIKEFQRMAPGIYQSVTATRAEFFNASSVEILPASPKSVHGPHVPTLILDEVDELDADRRNEAMGMNMALNGIPATLSMLSTWHKVGGPMTELIEQARAGKFPMWRFCVFEILERCPEERSGPALENCPACPIQPWCHDTPEPTPRAKRSNGHYSIDSFCQKVSVVSRRVLESDFLCMGPQAAGRWFTEWDGAGNVDPGAEYTPTLQVHLAVDVGATMAAVFFQVMKSYDPTTGMDRATVYVLADAVAEHARPEEFAADLRETARRMFQGRIDHFTMDLAGRADTAVGVHVVDLFAKGNLRNPNWWPRYPGSVADQLAVLDSLVKAADGRRALVVHPRCVATIQAFEGYRRKKRSGQWMDQPEDPQHPHEDIIDALRGGIACALPKGRDVAPPTTRKVTTHYVT